MELPLFPVDFLAPAEMEIDTPGGGVEAARSMAGITGAIDMSGGPVVTVRYLQVQCLSPDQHRLWNKLRLQLNARTRSILVPFMTDWAAPVPDGLPAGKVRLGGVTHQDGAAFADGAGYSQATIQASLAADAALNAGTLSITVTGRALIGGEHFSIKHPTKSFHLYGVSDIDDATDNGDGSATYTVGISPPLREAAAAATALRFDRPLCLMRLAPGTTLPYHPEGWWECRQDIGFIESFATV